MAGGQAHIRTGDKKRYKEVLKQIGEHGVTQDEILEAGWAQGRRIKAERVMIVLEMIYQKAVQENGSLAAAEVYLDRILGKPKESLNLEADGVLNNYSDDELISRIVAVVKRTGQAGAGGSAD